LDATNDTQSLTTQEDEASQKLRDIATAADPAEGIRQGLEDVRNGRVRPVSEFFRELEAKHGLRKGTSIRRPR
jgi:hypothetical protein